MEAPRCVLLIEDEQTLRQSMVRGLSKLRNVEVIDAANVREAKQALLRHAPAIVISDLDLPDGSGIEVLAELDRVGARVPMLFVSAFLGKFRSRLPRRSDVEVFEKPMSLEQLRSLVEERLGVGVASDSSPFTVADYVQLAAMGRHSVVIELRSALVRGRVIVNGGQLWSASDTRGHGLEAFRRLAFAPEAQITCRTLARHDLPERDIDGSAESVLLDAARALDEAARSAPPPSAPPANELGGAPNFDRAFEAGVDALLRKDYARAVVAFTEAKRYMPDDRRVIANLQRLRDLGYT